MKNPRVFLVTFADGDEGLFGCDYGGFRATKQFLLRMFGVKITKIQRVQ